MEKSLSAFLNKGKEDNIKFVLSSRFKDSDGKVVEWEIAALSAKEIQQASNELSKKGKVQITDAQNAIMCKSVVFPDLKNAELQASYAVLGEIDLLATMLKPGEYALLRNKIYELCDLDTDINMDVQEAKN